MGIKDIARSLATEVTGVSAPDATDNAEERRIQEKQGGHHLPPEYEDEPALDDTDRNTDKIIKPVQQDDRLGERHSKLSNK